LRHGSVFFSGKNVCNAHLPRYSESTRSILRKHKTVFDRPNAQAMAKKKVLLMGKAQSGKTSMRSIIFANYLARDTMRLSPTLDVEHHHVRFLGDLVLNLWDCGGQEAFFESYFERDRETIFRGVEMLIYVFDIESDSPEKDFDHFAGVLEALEENSPDARTFVLVHKMDLVAEEEREMILQDRFQLIEEACASAKSAIGVHNLQCFGTSIWDETLYKAWSEIVTNLIPNISVLESHLDEFCRICDADEVVLFERATFLVISHSQKSSKKAASIKSTDNKAVQDSAGTDILTREEAKDKGVVEQGDESLVPTAPKRKSPHFDAHRFEKISNIVKQFKLSCGKTQSQFQGMEVRNSRFTAFIDAFTANTYIMVIVSDPTIHTAATLLNIKNARSHFERFIPRT